MNRDRILDFFLKELEQAFGPEAFDAKRKFISTGFSELDKILGGGVPLGGITEIFGNCGVGKSTLAYHIIASAQEEGLLCALIDADKSLERTYAEACGIRPEELLFSQVCDFSLREVFDIIREAVYSDAKLIVLDSLPALILPEVESIVLSTLRAATISRILRTLVGLLSRFQTALIVINHPGASDVITQGGRAIRRYALVRLQLSRKHFIRKQGEKIGFIVSVFVRKNKLAFPYGKTDFALIWGSGLRSLEKKVKC